MTSEERNGETAASIEIFECGNTARTRDNEDLRTEF
jgi:hypothetical protein